jgi:ComF family protein
MVYNCVRWLQTRLFPLHCRLCTAAVSSGYGLCTACREELPWLGTHCARCACPLPATRHDLPCGRCQRRPPAFDATTALFHYRPPVDHLIRRLKFSHELGLSPLLAGLLAQRLATRTAPLPGLLIPVPLHRTRLRERGFNQATELARCLGRTLGIAHDQRLCTRQRNTRPQSLLPATARRLNLRNAFAVTGALPAAHVAIIDDVMTSGHTGDELARTLKRCGAHYVELWVIARAGR